MNLYILKPDLLTHRSLFFFSFSVNNFIGERIFLSEKKILSKQKELWGEIPGALLLEGTYYISVNFKSLETFEITQKHEHIISFKIINRPAKYSRYNLKNKK